MTLDPNANWTAKNDAAVKRPIFAVNIDGTDFWYHDFEITGATADHRKFLRTISSSNHVYDPIRSESSIGGFSFELLKSAGIWNFEELFKAPVIVKTGYKGLDWADFELAAPTSYIQDIKINNDGTGFIFTCQDVQQQMNVDIFTDVSETTASGTIDSGTVSTFVDAALTDADDFWNGFYILITGGTGAGQAREITDWVQSTNTATVSPNFTTTPDNTSVYVITGAAFSEINPLTFWLQVMTSTGLGTNGAYDVLDADQGLGIDQTQVDITEVELIRDDFYPTWQASFVFTEEVNAKDFFQDEIYIAFALAPVVKISGKISLRSLLPPLPGYMQANNMGSTLTDTEIAELPGYKTEYRDIINTIIFKYDYDPVANDFDTGRSIFDLASRLENGKITKTIESKSIRTALNGRNLTDIIADRYFQRYAVLPAQITLKTKFSQRIIEAGDQLEITSARIPNVDSDDFDWTGRTAEVGQVAPDFDQGVINLTLRDNSVGGGKYGVISPAATPDFGGASAAQKKRYCWIDNGYLII